MLLTCAVVLGILGWRDPYGKAAAISSVLLLATATFSVPVRQTSSDLESPQPVVEHQTEAGG